MENFNRFIILIALISFMESLFGQDNSSSSPKSYYRELNIEGGLDWSMIYNDTVNQKLGTQPYVTFYYDNFISQHVRYTFFLTPVAIHQTLNHKSILRERYFQIEGGLSGGYEIVHNWWISAGGGYSYRLHREYKMGANAWQETPFEQPGLYFYGSTEYWVTTSSGFRLSSLVFKDGYVFKIGVFINYNTIRNKLHKKAKTN